MSKSSKYVLRETVTPYRAGTKSVTDLELPDWSGHIERPSKMGADEMLRYCESLLPLVRNFPRRRELRQATRCSAEFILK